MNLIKLREIHAMNKSKKHQLLDNFFLPKFIFIAGNLIIIVLVGESKFFTSNSPPATGVYYDEYIDLKRSPQTASSVEQETETNMEKSSIEICSRTCENGEKNEGKGLAEERKYLEEEEDLQLAYRRN
uniref:DUF4408 domain-containing protein n=1 Tax=Salix viminalis TaxID=40686 RepID=A0A6N2MVR6_SALVM